MMRFVFPLILAFVGIAIALSVRKEFLSKDTIFTRASAVFMTGVIVFTLGATLFVISVIHP